MICPECQQEFAPRRKGQRFDKSSCRSAWHRRETLPGTVKGLRQLASGAWSAIVHYPNQPEGISVGTSCRLETE